MEYTIHIAGSRVNRVKSELKNQIVKIEPITEGSDMHTVVIRVADSWDILQIFHAGIEVGSDIWKPGN